VSQTLAHAATAPPGSLPAPREAGAAPDAGADALLVVPEGTARPGDVPPEVFEAVLRTYAACRRLDMQDLARDLGVARTTLYRKAGGRERLLAALIWWRSRQAIAAAVTATAEQTGAARVAEVVRLVLSALDGNPSLQRFLEAEPVAALRVLTGPTAGVQSGFVACLERLLDLEVARGHLWLTLDSHTLAYVVCRIGESFLYADVIADRAPDVGAAVDVVQRLLAGASRPVDGQPSEVA
jgi:AcrR family transcriptional regulator